MTEQPVNDPGEDAGQPMRAWGPPIDETEESVEEEVADAIDEGMPLIPEDSAPPAEAVAEPEPAEPAADAEAQPEPHYVPAEPVAEVKAVDPEPPWEAVAEPVGEVKAVEPEPVASEPTTVLPEPDATAPHGFEPAVAVPLLPEPEDITAPTTQLGYSETVVVPADPATPDPTQAIFRDSPADPIPDPYADPLSEEAQKLAAERAARKEARDAALAATTPVPVVAPEPVVIKQRTNDKFFGSLGLFLLRLVVAGIFGIRGYQMLGDLAAAQERFASTLLAPYAQILAIAVGAIHLLIALALILGLLTRVAGLGVALVAGGALALVWWGPWSPFVAGQSGFLGELELVLTAVGVLLLFIGGGGWSIDRSFRSARARDKAARQLAP